MKSMNIVFIVVAIATAMVLGTTFGIINNYEHIAASHKAIQEQDSAQKDTANKENQKNDTAVQENQKDNEDASVPANNQQKVSDVSESGSFTSLSPEETKEILQMLTSLGYDQQQMNKSVISFQKANNVKATGILDNATLETMIQKITIQKAQALIY